MTPVPSIQPIDLDQALAFVPAFAAVLIRVGGLFVTAPLFAASQVPKRVKALMAVAISWCICLTVAPSIVWPASLGSLVVAIAGELAIGIAVGMCCNILFAGVQWAGEVIGQQFGFNLGEVFDPKFSAAGNVIGDVLYMLMLVIFLCVGGHRALLMGLNESFRIVPLLTSPDLGGVLETLVGILMASTILAVRLSGPVLTTLLIVDVGLGFIGKTMPQMNVMSAGMSMRSLIGLCVLAGGLVITGDAMAQSLVGALQSGLGLWHVRSIAMVPLKLGGVAFAWGVV